MQKIFLKRISYSPQSVKKWALVINFFLLQAPNMRAMQKLDEARGKLEETNKEFETVRKRAKQAKMNFERVKQERYVPCPHLYKLLCQGRCKVMTK